MIDFLRRKKRKLLIPDNGYSFDENDGTFEIVYERKPQPDFGALEYARESLGLPPFAPLGAGTGFLRLMVEPYVRAPQLVATQNVVTAGVPLVAGYVYGQPLLDVDGAYIEQNWGDTTLPDKVLAGSYNAPFSHHTGL